MSRLITEPTKGHYCPNTITTSTTTILIIAKNGGYLHTIVINENL